MTSAPDLVVRCPACGQFARLWQVAGFLRSMITAWSDGWLTPPLQPAPLLRCPTCRHAACQEDFAVLGQLVRPSVDCRLDLIAAGPSPSATMKAVRQICKTSLLETKELVAHLPATLLEDARAHEADAAYRLLADAGAHAVVVRQEVGESSPAEWRAAPPVDEIEEEATVTAFLDSHELPPEQERTVRLYLFQLRNHPYRAEGAAWVPVAERGRDQIANARRLAALLDESVPAELRAAIHGDPLHIFAVSA